MRFLKMSGDLKRSGGVSLFASVGMTNGELRGRFGRDDNWSLRVLNTTGDLQRAGEASPADYDLNAGITSVASSRSSSMMCSWGMPGKKRRKIR
jgi:hypothetical protein